MKSLKQILVLACAIILLGGGRAAAKETVTSVAQPSYPSYSFIVPANFQAANLSMARVAKGGLGFWQFNYTDGVSVFNQNVALYRFNDVAGRTDDAYFSDYLTFFQHNEPSAKLIRSGDMTVCVGQQRAKSVLWQLTVNGDKTPSDYEQIVVVHAPFAYFLEYTKQSGVPALQQVVDSFNDFCVLDR